MNTVETIPHETCLNCNTALMGAYCHVCGQDVRAAEPSLREFLQEFVEMMTHADGKVIRTLRRLILEPASLTCDYIRGKRASEIPPVRMFFVSLLFFFAFTSVEPFHKMIATNPASVATGSTGKDHDPLKQGVRQIHFGGPRVVQDWLRAHLTAAADDPDEVQHVMGEWAERVVLLLLPISALVLWLLYAWPRPVALYDHLIFSLHSLTVIFLFMTISNVAAHILPSRLSGWLTLSLILAMVAHLFFHLRGFYRRSVGGTLIRMVLLGVSTGFAALALLFVLGLIGLQLGAETGG
ncbi:DUF3667 domain-containing protein [Brytella acorum]|uniref:DUF3667 domain-containing protein n=1 Tax=Brytella acorum TaxID=2959299 RepID=A0AA35UPQ3_9PROT|nr:DUF3667 domain-containing protein [Brytella acorum]MDF3623737.1 DUF3667 domain-containing protein [Brytella acorum]CAI9119845.1 DUF3667 domain-containing protein [Brytella acorum]